MGHIQDTRGRMDMNSGCKCKGICERYDLKKRPDYAKGDVFCRVCERAFTRDFNAKLKLLNPDYKYCFCCHARVAEKARTKPTNYREEQRKHDYMRTYKDLGILSMQKAMMEAVKQKKLERRRQVQREYYHNNKAVFRAKESVRIRDRLNYWKERYRRNKNG